MTTSRFKITSVDESDRDKISSEIIPLINTENSIPISPPILPSFTSINEANQTSTRLFHKFLQPLTTNLSVRDLTEKFDASSLPVHHHENNINNEADSCYNTIQSNTGDTFLHELRSKHRELRNKKSDLSIDQRLALNRHHRHDRDITRAQDIFDIDFEVYDDDNIQNNLVDEDFHEKIRNDIFHELDRQRMKQFHKQHRQLVLGRALLLFITSLLAFMSITLIYVVIHLYDRAKYVDTKLPDKQFTSMIYDTATDI